MATNRPISEVERLRSQLRALFDSTSQQSIEANQRIQTLESKVIELSNRLGISPDMGDGSTPKVALAADLTRDRRAFLLLGRLGDIVNFLPVARDLAIKDGQPVVMLVSRGMEGVLEGVSYVQAVVLDVEPMDRNEGERIARGMFDNVTVVQVAGRGISADRIEESYNRDSWRLAGYANRWHDATLKTVFDRRHYPRERDLIQRIMPDTDRPVILLNCRSGYSSPFVGWQSFQEALIERWSDQVRFIDVGDLRCERFQDLLGVMELAAGMVTIDTATLHLASACGIPVMHLAPNLGRWRATTPRCHTLLSFVQDEWQKRIDSIHATIGHMVKRCGQRKIVHVCEYHEPEGERAKRAQTTWPANWNTVRYSRYVRSAREIGDRRDLPYLKDVLRFGMATLNGDEILVLTNDDTSIHVSCDAEIRRIMRRSVAASSRRVDFSGDPVEWCLRPVEEIQLFDERHIGRDLFAFQVDWLRRHLDMIPDMILGAPDWDLCMAAIVRMVAGSEWSIGDSPNADPRCELEPGYVLHERHHAVWMDSDGKDPSSQHNRKLLRQWTVDHLIGRDQDSLWRMQ